MAYYTSSTGYGTTGVKTVTCGFQPAGMRISLGAKSGTESTVSHRSIGQTDGTRQSYISTYVDGSFKQTKQGNTKMVSHYENVSGVLTEKVAAQFDSFTATEGKFNITTADSSYTFVIELWD